MKSKFFSGILPKNVIKVAFVDSEGKRINGLTVDDARKSLENIFRKDLKDNKES